ncbi:transglycosylase SLT domain-containing protein [Streptomyces klenkii]|uniref:transglycosylase SLT domain-containing protein n=1 Tax=Streptomyces klenkii TaxID=1420899 RepID=UPI0036F0A60A
MRSTISGYTRLPKIHKFSVAGIAATGAAVVAVAVAPHAFAAETASAPASAAAVKPVAWSADAFGETQQDALEQHTTAAVTAAKADAGKVSAEKERGEKQAANRSTERKAIEAKPAAPAAPAKKSYANNVDGWISEALDILRAKGIPASYEGIKKNLMRESAGNPRAINDWDVNAVNGVPSKGLLQVIDPTFKAYHVEGTSWDIYDPVANITAACNYAADKYGSMDNVNSAY